MTVSPVIVWALIIPYGRPRIYVYSIRRTRKEAIATLADHPSWPWRKLYREGWRAVQVEVSVA